MGGFVRITVYHSAKRAPAWGQDLHGREGQGGRGEVDIVVYSQVHSLMISRFWVNERLLGNEWTVVPTRVLSCCTINGLL